MSTPITTSKRPTKHRPMSDAEIRFLLEETIFFGIYVAQRNVDEYRASEKIPRK